MESGTIQTTEKSDHLVQQDTPNEGIQRLQQKHQTDDPLYKDDPLFGKDKKRTSNELEKVTKQMGKAQTQNALKSNSEGKPQDKFPNIIWRQELKKLTGFSKIIENLEKNPIFIEIVQRFIDKQDNLIFGLKELWTYGNQTTYAEYQKGIRKTDDGAHEGHIVHLGKEQTKNNEFYLEPTLVAKLIIHESIHALIGLIRQNEGIDKNYPELQKHLDLEKIAQKKIDAKKKAGEKPKSEDAYDGEHNYMAEAYFQKMLIGVKGFDKAIGMIHSEDWYAAMVYRGSLTKTKKWENEPNREKYIQIHIMEKAYEEYKKAKLIHKKMNNDATRRSKDNKLKRLMEHQKLFNETRKRPANAPIE